MLEARNISEEIVQHISSNLDVRWVWFEFESAGNMGNNSIASGGYINRNLNICEGHIGTDSSDLVFEWLKNTEGKE